MTSEIEFSIQPTVRAPSESKTMLEDSSLGDLLDRSISQDNLQLNGDILMKPGRVECLRRLQENSCD
jgi:hypothetical protein